MAFKIHRRAVSRNISALSAIACVVSLLVLTGSAQAAFPGKNGKIAFDGQGIEALKPDGSGRTALVDPSFYASNPSWSADGTRLAFLHYYGPGGQHLAVSDASGGNLTSIAVFGNRGGMNNPSWSPDGSQIVLVENNCLPTYCFQSLRRINSDGTGLTSLRTDGREPNWSPLGDKIAFTDTGTICSTNQNGFPVCNYQIFTVNPDGTGRTRITDDTTNDFDPNWSPDGSKIVFATSRHVQDPANCFGDCNVEIYVMNADGSGQTRLTNSPGVDQWPAWSPDGKKIVFTSYRDDPDLENCISCNTEIYVMNADGSNQVRLTDTPELAERMSDWQPVPGPQRSDYKNAAQFCKALREFLGDEAFRSRYGGGANAHGKCVTANRR